MQTRQKRIPLGGAMGNVLVLCAATVIVVSAWVLFDLHGGSYYFTPLRIRGYNPAHSILKPSGTVGHTLGIIGLVMMAVPITLYSMRKRWKRMRNLGSLNTWLEVHIYFGVVGSVLVTYHTAAKFNGIISVAYWSMVFVVLSGFIGRYLYVRIPKTIRGTELGYDEIAERATDLKIRLVESGLSTPLLQKLDRFEQSVVPDKEHLSLAGYVFEQARIRRGLRRVRHEMVAAGVDAQLLDRVLHVTAERASLLGRLAYLQKTKQFFGAWHVFHQPLVYVMFVIAVLHVGLALYFGYMPF